MGARPSRLAFVIDRECPGHLVGRMYLGDPDTGLVAGSFPCLVGKRRMDEELAWLSLRSGPAPDPATDDSPREPA